MMSASLFRFIKPVLGVSVLVLTASMPLRVASQPITSKAQYQMIAEPAIAQLEPLMMVVSPVSSPFSMMIVESWRIAALTFLGAQESKVDHAMAKAITVNTVKNIRIGLEPAIQGARSLIAKLKTDLKWYEDEFSFMPGFEPTDPTDREYWEHYQAIIRALKEYHYTVPLSEDGSETERRMLTEAEKTLELQAKEVTDGLVHVSNKLQKAAYGLPSLKASMGFMAQRMEPLNRTIDGIERMAEQLYLDEHTPRKQFRGVLTNKSKDLVFFVQVMSLDENDEYVLRPDTRYPVTIYPDVSGVSEEELKKIQIAPFGRRGASQTTLPLKLRDKIVMRVATMQQLRDRIRFMLIKGKNVTMDLQSLSRSFYYLGYQAVRGDGANIVSRWYPVNESYTWQFRRGWSSGETANDPVLHSSEGKAVRGFGPDFTLRNDRMEWIMPAGFATAFELRVARAIVSGTTEVLKVGPTSGNRRTLSEEGSGQFELQLKTW